MNYFSRFTINTYYIIPLILFLIVIFILMYYSFKQSIKKYILVKFLKSHGYKRQQIHVVSQHIGDTEHIVWVREQDGKLINELIFDKCSIREIEKLYK